MSVPVKTWRDDLRRVSVGGRQLIGASFRGVAFFVDTGDRGGGRRTVVHEFPLRDDPYVEDLGRRARTFRVDGYVLGDNYLTQRDALLAALEDTEGPGELVHPYHGVRRAICVTVTVRESRAEGGIAMFAIEFTETPAQATAPVEVVDGPGQVAASANAARAATKAELVEKYILSVVASARLQHATADPMLPSFGLESAAAALTKASRAMATELGPIVTTTQELSALTGKVALLTATAVSLVRTPGDLIDAFGDALGGLVETAIAAPGAVMDALFNIYDTDLGPLVIGTTATRTREAANQLALTGALRRVIAIEAARLAPVVAYVSIEAAIAARDQVAAMLDEQATSADDTAYPALVDLRSQVLRAVPGGAAFARVTTVTRVTAIPSLLFAYQLYGSVDLELDIIARNGVRHPGFIVGDLKVLSDV